MKYVSPILLIAYFTLSASSLAANVIASERDKQLIELHSCVVAFALKNGSFPAGSNAEISRQLATIGFRGRVDEKGRIVDPSGSPYQFLPLEEKGMAIVSLGEKDERGYHSPRVVIVMEPSK